MAVITTPWGHCSAFAVFYWVTSSSGWAEHFCCCTVFARRFFVPNKITFLLEAHGYSFFSVSLFCQSHPSSTIYQVARRKNVASTMLKDRGHGVRWDKFTSSPHDSFFYVLWILRDYYIYSVETRKVKLQTKKLQQCYEAKDAKALSGHSFCRFFSASKLSPYGQCPQLILLIRTNVFYLLSELFPHFRMLPVIYLSCGNKPKYTTCKEMTWPSFHRPHPIFFVCSKATLHSD